MSLFSTLQMAGNSLQAVDIGLQVVGQNIANANTPGYSREVENLTPGPTQRLGNVLIGSGVEVSGIVEQVNNYTLQSLYGANSDQSSTQTQSSTYQQLETLMGELSGSGTDLTTSVSNFFSSVQNVLDQPESNSVRSLAVQSGQTLAANINSEANQVEQMQAGLNSQISSQAGQINQLVDQIQQLNLQIESFQGGQSTGSDAVGLIDQRNTALTSLSQIVNINVQQQPNGGVDVYVGGDNLVSDGEARQVAAATTTNASGQTVTQLVMADTQSPLQATSGTYAGLLNSRDQILGGFLNQLNGFSNTLATEFNKIYASGQGLTGYSQVTSQNSVSNPQVPLENAGLPSTPVNGSFQVLVTNSQTGQTQTNTINVSLNGLGQDTTLDQVAAQLNNISGLSASVSSTGQLSISSQNSNLTFAFANDNSGLLTSLGINTFFTGNSAATLSVNSDVANDPSLFAASQGGVGQDTNNVQQLAALNDAPLADQNGNSLSDLQNQIVQNVTDGSAAAKAQTNGASTYQQGVEAQNQSISGVNLDEETLNMITLQQTYQASAQLVSTLNSLLQMLTQL
jgi:flagellar hook-associated protein 1 FlgK